jgi:hypothetical protein
MSNLLGCSFLMTNIPLGAYLLRLGAYFRGNKLLGSAVGFLNVVFTGDVFSWRLFSVPNLPNRFMKIMLLALKVSGSNLSWECRNTALQNPSNMHSYHKMVLLIFFPLRLQGLTTDGLGKVSTKRRDSNVRIVDFWEKNEKRQIFLQKICKNRRKLWS